ncbi:hypothetical protein NHX12_006088 [Muraenolepis orangiensis]|uniref:Uncharacterized protein n=1 Tax=Muraenolepis orangiensis TaxID=630683 RepID=A0A9Q0ICJ3_9TELE|nr:hypothetical protein NHX12_006088 [Muraenolepis orangiensis]
MTHCGTSLCVDPTEQRVTVRRPLQSSASLCVYPYRAARHCTSLCVVPYVPYTTVRLYASPPIGEPGYRRPPPASQRVDTRLLYRLRRRGPPCPPRLY